MSAALALTVLAYALVVAVGCLGAAVRGQERSPVLELSLVVLAAGSVLLAALDLVDVLRGADGETATNLAYAGATALALPAVAAAVRMDPHRWGSASLGVACLLLAVLAFRLHATLGPVPA